MPNNTSRNLDAIKEHDNEGENAEFAEDSAGLQSSRFNHRLPQMISQET